MTPRPGIARAAALLVVLTAASQLLGLVRDAVTAAVYGAGSALDAYLYAQGVMNLVLALAAGAMAKAVVPPLARAAAGDDRARADRTLATALTVTMLVMLVGSVLVYVFAGAVVSVLAPGFDDATAALAVDVTRIVLVATLFIALTDILAAAAQAHGRYFHSGIQGVPFNLVVIAAAAWFGPGFGIDALAVGFVVGSAVRLLVQLPAVRAAGLRLRPGWYPRDVDVREVMRLMPPLLLTGAVVNVNTLVDRAVGSAQGEGVITALSLGWRIVTLVDTLLVLTVAAALYPAFSAIGERARRRELRDLVGASTRMMLVVIAPVSVALVVAAEPTVQVLFGRGEFHDRAVRLTGLAVAAYAVSAVGLAVRVIATRAFFALGDGRTPVAVAIVSMAVNVVGDLTLGVRYGVLGLAGSTSLSLVLGGVLLMVLLARRHAAAPMRDLAATCGRVLVAASLAGVAAVVVRPDRFLAGAGSGASLVQVATTATIVVLVYTAVLAILRSRELPEIWDVLSRRLHRR